MENKNKIIIFSYSKNYFWESLEHIWKLRDWGWRVRRKKTRVSQCNKVAEIVKGNRIQTGGQEIGGEDFYPNFKEGDYDGVHADMWIFCLKLSFLSHVREE